MLTVADQFMLALTAWRENRGGGVSGMQSVMNVILNRAARDRSTPYAECVKRLQFSSITAKGDPELTLWPVLGTPDWLAWQQAQQLVAQAVAGALQDITSGATDYYAPHGLDSGNTVNVYVPGVGTTPFPKGWNAAAVQYTATIGGQLFFRDV